MKKIILFLLLTLTFINSYAQYSECEFTLNPDSSCIKVGQFYTYPGGDLDTLWRVRGTRPSGEKTSYFRVYTEKLIVDKWKTKYIGSINSYGFVVVDTLTGEVKSVSSSKIPVSSSQVTSALGFTPYNATNPNGYISSYTETDPLFDTKFNNKSTTNLTEGTNLYFTNSRARSSISLTTTGSSGLATYNNSTGVLNIPNYSVIDPTITNTVNRTLNSNYTISSTQRADVYYSVTCSVTNPLLAGSSTATAYLEYSINSGSSWITISQTGNSSSVGVAVAISITNSQTTLLSGAVPANALVRIRTATTGTASVTYVTGQEVQF